MCKPVDVDTTDSGQSDPIPSLPDPTLSKQKLAAVVTSCTASVNASIITVEKSVGKVDVHSSTSCLSIINPIDISTESIATTKSVPRGLKDETNLYPLPPFSSASCQSLKLVNLKKRSRSSSRKNISHHRSIGNRNDSKTALSSCSSLSSGRWTKSEHQAFLIGLAAYGREWKRVATHIPTRNSSQVRSHAQKYFTRLQLEQQMQQQQQLQMQAIATVVSLSSSSGSEYPLRDESKCNYQSPASFLLDYLSIMSQAPTSLSPAVQSNVERILAQPETVHAEVDETLRKLRELYRDLHFRLIQQQERQQQERQSRLKRSRGVNPALTVNTSNHDAIPSSNSDSCAPIEKAMSACIKSSSLHDSEIIALHVLQGGMES